MAKRKFTVDILVYLSNRPDSVKSCLQALLKYHSPSSNIILIGDKLSNTLHSFILGLCSKCRNEVSIGLLNNTAHLGYVNSINKHLSRGSSEYVVVIDDNVIVTKGWIEKLQSCIENDPTTGIVCPVTSIGFRQSVCKDLPNNFTIDSFADYISKTTLKKYPETTSADFCLFFRRELIQKVGNFSPVTFTEVDYCHRARQQGYKIVVADDTFIFTRNSCVSGVVADDALFFATKPLRHIQYNQAQQDTKVVIAKKDKESLKDIIKQETKKISIIIPVHNQLEMVRSCVESIYSHTNYDNFNVILVDDASDIEVTRGLEEVIKERSRIYILTLSERQHYASACNAGIELQQADYYILLNSDTMIGTSAWLEKIVECGDRYPKCGILSVLSNNALQQSVPYPKNESPSQWANVITYCTESRYPIRYMPHGFCYIIKDWTIKKVGYFNQSLFPHYGGEDDYSLRCLNQDIEGRLVDDVFIWHQGAVSYSEEFKVKATRSAAQKLFKLYGNDRIKKLKQFVGIDYLIYKLKHYERKQMSNTSIDYIVPVCNIEPQYFDNRLYNLQFIIDHQLIAQKRPVNLVIVEQQIDKDYKRFADYLKFNALSHQIVHRDYPVFCKGWLQNIAIQETRNPFFILAEMETFTPSNAYCSDLLEYCQKEHLQWCIGWNKILYLDEDQVQQLRKGMVPISAPLSKVPKRGGAEGGMVIYNRKFWEEKIYGADETYKWLGGMDNELAYRSRKSSNQYRPFAHTIYHLWHPISFFKNNSEQRKQNTERYFRLIKKKEWEVVTDIIKQHKLGGNVPISFEIGE